MPDSNAANRGDDIGGFATLSGALVSRLTGPKGIAYLCLSGVMIAVVAPAILLEAGRIARPQDAIVGTCVSLLAGTLLLWLMDLSGLARFSNPWASKAIWVAAVVAILGAGASTFSEVVQDTQHPLNGKWHFALTRKAGPGERTDHGLDDFYFDAILCYDRTLRAYRGYSEVYRFPGSGPGTACVGNFLVERLDPDGGALQVRWNGWTADLNKNQDPFVLGEGTVKFDTKLQTLTGTVGSTVMLVESVPSGSTSAVPYKFTPTDAPYTLKAQREP